MSIQSLMEKLATYNFQCDGGPLHLCVDYQKLCAAALLLEDTLICPGHIDGHYCRHCEATIECSTAQRRDEHGT